MSDNLEALTETCREIQTGGIVSSSLWHKLSGGRINNLSLVDSMRASKEKRVEVFESIARSLVNEAPDPLLASFLVGYLANLVSDGSLEHAHLVFPLQDRLPTAMLRYGICAGLSPQNRVQSDYNHLGLRIQRSLCRSESLLSIPSCDISIHELIVLLRGDPRARGFRQTHSSLLRVEIAPLVTTVVKWLGRPAAGGQLNLFAGDERPAPIESERLAELARTLRTGLAYVESILGNKPTQPTDPAIPHRGKKRR